MVFYFQIEAEVSGVERHRYRVTAPNEVIAKSLMNQAFDEIAGTEPDSDAVPTYHDPAGRVVYLKSEIVPESIAFEEANSARPSLKLLYKETTLKDNYEPSEPAPVPSRSVRLMELRRQVREEITAFIEQYGSRDPNPYEHAEDDGPWYRLPTTYRPFHDREYDIITAGSLLCEDPEECGDLDDWPLDDLVEIMDWLEEPAPQK